MKLTLLFAYTTLSCATLGAASGAFAGDIYVDNIGGCYPISLTCTGTSSKPFKTIADGVSTLNSGSTLFIKKTGLPYYIYDGGNLPNGITQFPDALISGRFNSVGNMLATVIKAYPADKATNPVLRGTIKIGGWTSHGSGYYSRSWTMQRNDGNGILDPQQIFRAGLPGQPDIQLKQRGGQVYGGYPDYPNGGNGYPGIPADMRTAASSSGPNGLWPGRNSSPSVTSGKPDLNDNEFFFDRASNTIYIKLPLQPTATTPGSLAPSEKLEISVLRYLVRVAGANKLQIQNLTFERTNTSSYSRGGALSLDGKNILVDGVVVQDADSQCLDLSGSQAPNVNTVIKSKFLQCGHLGIHVIGADNQIKSNTVKFNNTRGFNNSWEAGGLKAIGKPPMTSSTIDGNTFALNNGDGIWLDSGNNNNTISGNIAAYNSNVGIHIELSSGNKIQQNIMLANSAQGLQIIDSSNTSVTDNVILGNLTGGIYAANDSRLSTGYDVRTGNSITSNAMGWNDDTVNFESVNVNSQIAMDNNVYCGNSPSNDPSTGKPSVRFWLSDGVPGANIYFFSNWPNAGSPAKARDVRSIMRVMAYPPNLASYIRARNLDEPSTMLNAGKNSCPY